MLHAANSLAWMAVWQHFDPVFLHLPLPNLFLEILSVIEFLSHDVSLSNESVSSMTQAQMLAGTNYAGHDPW